MYDTPVSLIVDDEKSVCDLLYEQLECAGYACDYVQNAEDALVKLEKKYYDVTLLDIRLPRMSGIDLLKILTKCYPMTAVVMMTAVNDLDVAVEVMKLGASDYICKPFTFDKLNTGIEMALRNRKARCVNTNSDSGILDGKRPGFNLSQTRTVSSDSLT